MVAVRTPSMRNLDELLEALQSERNSFAASNVMDRAREELIRMRESITIRDARIDELEAILTAKQKA